MSVEKFKTIKCKVLSYNKVTKELDIDFSGYGIRLRNVSKNVEDFVNIRYRGEIGTSNFEYRLQAIRCVKTVMKNT